MDSPLKVIILTFLFNTCYALDGSLMLSSTEEDALTQAQQQAKISTKGQEIKHTSLRLDGIIYSHQKSWTIWLNGRPIKAGQKIDKLQIKKVTPDTVELIWSPSSDHSYSVCLKTNEVFSQ
jgi:hypothetical protein